MARITVEDCLQNVDNLFHLVLLASQRARRLANGAEPTVALGERQAHGCRPARDRRRHHHGRNAQRAGAAPVEATMPDAESLAFRAPQFGLGD